MISIEALSSIPGLRARSRHLRAQCWRGSGFSPPRCLAGSYFEPCQHALGQASNRLPMTFAAGHAANVKWRLLAMDIPKKGTSEMEQGLTDRDIVRVVWGPGHAAKRMARLLAVSLDTARNYVEHKFSEKRRAEIARTLLEVMDQQDQRPYAHRVECTGLVETRISNVAERINHTARRLARDAAAKK